MRDATAHWHVVRTADVFLFRQHAWCFSALCLMPGSENHPTIETQLSNPFQKAFVSASEIAN